MQKNTELKDSLDKPILLGSIVEVTNPFNGFKKGYKLICVWNVPNHRFGFHPLEHEEYEIQSNRPSEFLYLTPKSASKLKVI